ncbi:General secretion pathway protein K [Fimbriimonas ginsengisoli Gsoil 348]|uniref:General secretion pathway protein K n=1 Tax=Fimbriimonas ginsengisoli Gsoil 348 TaxID=661478 RepID=A0A068NRC2_FIMGI|nr:General secretion pathway protein K [Fimbriimonas ginsengisoli Gsoil 348]
MLSLLVLTALVAIVAGLASTNRSAVRAETNRMEERRARLMLESGIQRAIAELQQQDLTRTTAHDPWNSLGDAGATEFTVGQDGFRIQLLDASANAELNGLTEAQLRHLPLTQAQIDCFLDWKESAKTPRAQGAKDEYYNRLSKPYNAKLEPFDNVDELLMVKGFTYGTVYTLDRRETSVPLAAASVQMPILADIVTVGSVSADKNINGKPKLDIGKATADDLAQLGITKDIADTVMRNKSNYKKVSDLLKISRLPSTAARIFADNVTVGQETQQTGRININTATQAVLSTIDGIEPDVAAAIVGRQSSGFRTLGELLDVPGIDVPKLAKFIDYLCVSSRTFTARIVGMAGRSRVAAEVQLVIDDDGGVKVTRWRPQDFWTIRDRWGWEKNSTRQVVLGATS